jgi:hippurate hydrolase
MLQVQKAIFDKITQEAIAIRQDLHQHPEGGLSEFRTAKIVAKYLKSCGIEVITGVGKTGVVGTLTGTGKSKKVLGLRADMDALPMEERTTVPYKSVNKGFAHACGHDGHTATLLAVAKCLSHLKQKFSGTIHFFFQPAEEGLGGARLVINHPAWKSHKPDMMFGMHYWATMKLGTAAVLTGPTMAAAGKFIATIKGKGGHGAHPENTTDPINAAAHCIVALNTIKAKENNPFIPITVTTTMVHAGTSFNIIPPEAIFCGTLRSFNDAQQRDIGQRIKRVVTQTARAHRCKARVLVYYYYPVTENNAKAVDIVQRALVNSIGSSNVDTGRNPSMGAEDFSFYAQQVPAAYFMIGTGPSSVGVHNPAYNFNDTALPIGCRIWMSVVEEFFRSRQIT